MVKRKVLQVPDGYICDYIDGTFRKDTPEEYVRQIIEKRLVNEHGYKADRIKVEYTLRLGSKRPRVDIAIFQDDETDFAQENIFLIVECKSDKVKAEDKKDGVGQLKSYMSACPNCEWGMWTNGKHREVWRKVLADG